jgi:hypothetical protein
MRFTDNLELKIASTEDMAHLHDEDPESWIVIQEAIKMVLDKPIK